MLVLPRQLGGVDHTGAGWRWRQGTSSTVPQAKRDLCWVEGSTAPGDPPAPTKGRRPTHPTRTSWRSSPPGLGTAKALSTTRFAEVVAFPADHFKSQQPLCNLITCAPVHRSRIGERGRAGREQIVARAGHASASIGLNRYGHLFLDRDADLTAWLDALVAAGRGDAVSPLFNSTKSRQGLNPRGSRPRRSGGHTWVSSSSPHRCHPGRQGEWGAALPCSDQGKQCGRGKDRTCGLCRVNPGRPPHRTSQHLALHHISAGERRCQARRRGAL
jgi:hypothetical protein